MKKKTRFGFMVTCALTAMICGIAGVGAINNYIGTEEEFCGKYSYGGFTAYAEETETAETEAESVIGKTKFNVSVNKDYLLVVTTLTDVSTVYEVGYDFGSSYTVAEGDQAEKKNYYTSIKAGDNIWSATDIFGETYTAETPMIVWEVAYNAAKEYSCKAYAKTGTRDENGLHINDPETVAYGNSITVAVPRYTITLNKNNGTTNTVIDDVAYGTTAEILYSETYLPARDDTFEFIGWYYGTTRVETAMTVTQDMTLVAKYSLKDGEGFSSGSAAIKNNSGKVDASYDQKWIALPIEKSVASVGDTLEITMDMFIRPDESQWESMPLAVANDSAYLYNCEKEYLQADKTGNVRANWTADELNQWHTFTFEAVVLNKSTIQRDEDNAQITIDEEQYVLLWWYSAGNGITLNNNGAKAEWYYKQPTSIVNNGKAANSQVTKNSSGKVDASYDYKWIVLPIDGSVASVGDTLEITMDMFIRPDESTWESMPVAVSGNYASYVYGGTKSYLQADKTGNVRADNWATEELGQWHTFTFKAVVVNEQTIQRDATNAQITINEEQYVLLWWNSAGNGIAANNNGAKAVWRYKQPTSIVNNGRIANSQNDVDVSFTHKWIAIEIDESIASVGDTVQITMDMFIKPENCNWEDMPCIAVSFWSNNTVKLGEAKKIQANKTGTWKENWATEELGQWHTFTFEAVVINQAQVLKDEKNTAVTMPTTPYVLLWWQSAGAGKTNAAAEWYYKQPTAIQKVSA